MVPLSRRRLLVLAGTALAAGACDVGSSQGGRPWPTPPRPLTVDELPGLDRPFYIAHRGGSANWPEMTMPAYERAVAAGVDAIEVSVHRSSDGVWVCAHDADLQRVTGTPVVIADTSWADLQQLQVTPPRRAAPDVDPAPLARVEEVLGAFAGTRIVFIEDKTYQHQQELIDLLLTYPDPQQRFVWKVFGNSGEQSPLIGKNAGFTTWGYWFVKDLPEYFDNVARVDWVGVDFESTDEQLDQARSAGKLMIGHRILNAPDRDRMLAAGCKGIMLADVDGTLPR